MEFKNIEIGSGWVKLGCLINEFFNLDVFDNLSATILQGIYFILEFPSLRYWEIPNLEITNLVGNWISW